MSKRISFILRDDETKEKLVRIAGVADISVNDLINWILEAQFDIRKKKSLMLLRDLMEARLIY